MIHPFYYCCSPAHFITQFLSYFFFYSLPPSVFIFLVSSLFLYVHDTTIMRFNYFVVVVIVFVCLRRVCVQFIHSMYLPWNPFVNVDISTQLFHFSVVLQQRLQIWICFIHALVLFDSIHDFYLYFYSRVHSTHVLYSRFLLYSYFLLYSRFFYSTHAFFYSTHAFLLYSRLFDFTHVFLFCSRFFLLYSHFFFSIFLTHQKAL